MKNRPPKFSSLKSLRILQEKLILEENAELSILDSLLAERKCPSGLIVFYFNWLHFKKNTCSTTNLVKLLRKHKFNRPSLYEYECRWVWAIGWRERACSMAAKAYEHWKTEGLFCLMEVMRDGLKKETREEFSARTRHIESMDLQCLPFNPDAPAFSDVTGD